MLTYSISFNADIATELVPYICMVDLFVAVKTKTSEEVAVKESKSQPLMVLNTRKTNARNLASG